MPRKASGESYVWIDDKEKLFLEKLDEYLAARGGKQPTSSVLELWATEFNTRFGGVPAFGLGYDPVTDTVVCSDETWRGFVKDNKECTHFRYEGLRHKEFYYNIFEKNHAAGASGFGSVTMGGGSTPSFEFDFSMDQSGTQPDMEDGICQSIGARRHANTSGVNDESGPSRSRGSTGKRKQRDVTDEMTYEAMQEIANHFRANDNVTLLRCASTASAAILSARRRGPEEHYCLSCDLPDATADLNFTFGSTPRHDENTQAVPNEQGEDDDMVARAVVAMINSRRNRRRVPQPMHDSILTGSMRVEEILNGHQDVIQGMISMKSSTFRALSNLLGSRELLTPTNHMNVNEQLFIFLAICSQGATNRHVSYLFQHSQETTSRWFFRVLKVICALKDEFIRPPDYTTVQPLINENEGKYRPWFDVRYPCYIFKIS
ncbi:hypothetical protein TIFTF001_027207 [Ficus carica]|uniref:DUF8040 domain-containing protein n=1 Tax=Ficus carica TaxID=3494 RepID=A0AA88DMI8_FICCA|nr:hypothetical protein TIFTF001_027207 [Ficus carica]